MTFYTFFGVLAGAFEIVACGLYIFTILRGETKPNRVTWWIIALVNGLITSTYFASGARETVLLPLAYTLGFLSIALLSIRYGEGSTRLSTLDRISLLGAGISVVIWVLIRSPVPSLFVSILTECIGIIPTINKSYLRPETENPTAWILATIASILNLIAIKEWTYVVAIYPVYLFTTNVLIVYFLLRKKV